MRNPAGSRFARPRELGERELGALARRLADRLAPLCERELPGDRLAAVAAVTDTLARAALDADALFALGLNLGRRTGSAPARLVE